MDNQLSVEEIDQIKNEIIESSEKHTGSIENLEYEEVMKFYGIVDNFVKYGDGFYWGDYLTGDGIWKDFLKPKNWKGNFKWDLSNHKIHVFSKEAASLLVEFDHERTTVNGDNTKGHWLFLLWYEKNGWRLENCHCSCHSQLHCI